PALPGRRGLRRDRSARGVRLTRLQERVRGVGPLGRPVLILRDALVDLLRVRRVVGQRRADLALREPGVLGHQPVDVAVYVQVGADQLPHLDPTPLHARAAPATAAGVPEGDARNAPRAHPFAQDLVRHPREVAPAVPRERRHLGAHVLGDADAGGPSLAHTGPPGHDVYYRVVYA